MDALEEELKALCKIAPHWQQLLLQGFWYGLLSWLITCAEDSHTPSSYPMTLLEIVTHADPKFATWPLEWLQVYVDKMIELNPVLDSKKLNEFLERLDTIFRDTIRKDLDIFSTLIQGEQLTEQQWDLLSPPPSPPPPPPSPPPQPQHPHTIRNNHRTRRLRGKRAITPLKRKRAVTHHRHHVKVVKENT